MLGKVIESAQEGALHTAGMSVSSLAGRAADFGVAKGLMTKPGLKQAKTMRGASFLRLVHRMTRKGRAANRVTQVDELSDVKIRLAKEGDEIKKYTPEWFGGRNVEQRAAGIQRLRELSGEAFEGLNKVELQNMLRNLRGVRTSVNGLSNKIRGFNKKIKMPAAMKELENIDEAMYDFRVVEAFDHAHNAGYGDIAGQLENTFHLDHADVSFGRWVQARFDAKIGKAPGSTVMDNAAKNFIEDAGVWGENIAGRGVEINKAIDKIVDAHDELSEFANKYTDKFDNFYTDDVKAMENIDVKMDEIRQGYNTLREQGVLTYADVKDLETSMGKVTQDVTRGKKAGFQASQINKARDAAKDMNKKMASETTEKIALNEAEVVALADETAMGGGIDLVSLGELARDRLLNLEEVKGTRRAVFGILALKERTTNEEKMALYNVIEQRLGALVGNPEALAANMQDMTGNLNAAAPQLMLEVQMRSANTMYYLASQMPKPDQSFYGRHVPPPMSRVNAFLDKAMAAAEPMSVGIAAVEGRVTPGMVHALRNTSPAIYAEMMNVFSEQLHALTVEERRNAPRYTVLGIESFLGGMNPAHVGMSLMQLQSTYAQTAEQNQAIQGTGSTMKSQGPQDAASDYTSTQRITGF